MASDQNEAIAKRAHEIWVESGYPHGHDKEHWQQAERQLDGIIQTENVTGIGQPHDDGVSALPAQNDDVGILHRVPDPGL